MMIGEPYIWISKEDFFNLLKSVMENEEVSWLTTDIQSFEWHEINADKTKFIEKLKKLDFKKVFIAIYNPKTKQNEYHKFMLVSG